MVDDGADKPDVLAGELEGRREVPASPHALHGFLVALQDPAERGGVKVCLARVLRQARDQAGDACDTCPSVFNGPSTTAVGIGAAFALRRIKL